MHFSKIFSLAALTATATASAHQAGCANPGKTITSKVLITEVGGGSTNVRTATEFFTPTSSIVIRTITTTQANGQETEYPTTETAYYLAPVTAADYNPAIPPVITTTHVYTITRVEGGSTVVLRTTEVGEFIPAATGFVEPPF